MTPEQIILGIHAASTLAMAGLIWFVQVVHYPMFSHVGGESFAQYERAHQRRTTLVVGPLMLVELATAGLLAFRPPESGAWMAWLGLALVGCIWASTALVQVRLHRRLERGFDEDVLGALVLSNWVRTVLWSVRGVLAILLLGASGA